MRIALAASLTFLLALPSFALPPDSTIRPLARGQEATILPAVLQPRPRLRPARLEQAVLKAAPITRRIGAPGAPTSDDLAANTPGVVEANLAVRSLRPTTRPKSIAQKAMARQREERKGRLAGIRGIQGEQAGNIPGNGACGIRNALRVTHVSGIRLTQAALMDKTTAKALKTWVDKGLKPAVGNMGGGVASIRVAAHYACRTRNNRPGAKLSEHGRGRAIDISAINLRNGDKISVLQHWGGGAKGRALQKMHRAACGPFGTVLGPNADRFHKDHFHFDTARYRSGSYCR
ncbi:extensin family protein [Primorskyibacter sp. S187A]|uniref:extensin-like domain-containing protein n=1 Tax=Primorskyibacter sp. S187A TaxID=3415130 RepID=UPI003C7DF185